MNETLGPLGGRMYLPEGSPKLKTSFLVYKQTNKLKYMK